MRRTEILNLFSCWPNGTVLHTPGNEENKFRDAFWFIAPVWFLNNTAILDCCMHLKSIPVPSEMNYSSYIFNWSSHKFLFFFLLQENNYKTLNHFYNALWKQKPLIWVMIWMVCTGHSGCSSASLPACSSSSSGGTTCFNLTISQLINTTHLLLSSHAPQKGSQTRLNITLPKPCAWLSFQQEFQASQTGSRGCAWS